ncbi:hypothetical protein SESBI_39012, partial [Sesbania bispinosa]
RSTKFKMSRIDENKRKRNEVGLTTQIKRVLNDNDNINFEDGSSNEVNSRYVVDQRVPMSIITN